MDSTEKFRTNEPLNVISFCAGYGGIERGLDLAGINHRVIAYVEIEAFAIANLVAKMESGELDSAPIWSDLKTFPAHLFRDCVDIITGGYPCQPFSVAGKARTTEESFSDPRHLFPYILDHVQTIRPSQCFFENVEGHINRGLREVIGDLEELGYTTTWGLFSAEEVGAPHQRKRVFILGRLSDSYFEGLEGSVFGGIAEEETEKPVTRCGKEGDKLSDSANFGFGGTLPIEDREGEGRNDACGEGATEGMGATELGNPASERPRGGSEDCEGEQSEVLGERLESDELAHRKHKRLGGRPASGSSGVDGEGSEIAEEGQEGDGLRCEVEGCGGESRELANPASGQPGESQARNGRKDTGGGSEEELVNPVGGRFEQRESECEKEDFVGEGGQPTQWPARPGEEQYEWEEPRVVANSRLLGQKEQKQQATGVEQHSDREQIKSEAQSELGGTIDGTRSGVDATANRVDRLR